MNARVLQSSNEDIHWYLQDLARMPVLSPKAVQDVLQQIAAAPDSAEAHAARTRLIEAHLRLVVRLARCYQPFGPELADLIQEGNLALTKATLRFDPQQSQNFGSFASRGVCWALSHVVVKHLHEKHLLDSDVEPIYPLSARVQKARLRNAIDEQAIVFDLPEERFISLDALLAEEDTDASSSYDRSSDHACFLRETDDLALDENVIAQERDCVVSACLYQLTTREQVVLTRRYLLDVPQSLEEVGRALRLTREMVRQIEQRGLRKLRHPHHAKLLQSLL